MVPSYFRRNRMGDVDYGYEDMGYGDAQPDYGYGDGAPATDYGYGDGSPSTDYGYGDAAPSVDYGYGDDAPATDYGYGDSAPAQPAEPKRRPKRRCSVTKFSLQSPEAAKQELETGIEATGPAPTEDEKSIAKTEESSDEMEFSDNANEAVAAPIEKKKFNQLKNMKSGMKKFGKRLSIF